MLKHFEAYIKFLLISLIILFFTLSISIFIYVKTPEYEQIPGKTNASFNTKTGNIKKVDVE